MLNVSILVLNFVSNLAQVKESKVHIAFSNTLAVNNNPLEDLPLRFLFCRKYNRL